MNIAAHATRGKNTFACASRSQHEDDGVRSQIVRAGIDGKDTEWLASFWEGVDEGLEGMEVEGWEDDEDRKELKRRLVSVKELKDSFL